MFLNKIFIIFNLFITILAIPEYSEECRKANTACEEDTDCVHRLAVLQSTCITNTCQPQCRTAALNLYQNRLGRSLLRTDVSCLPSRSELDLCGLLPNKSRVYCSLAKLACEADLKCTSKWETFITECETEADNGQCNSKCRERFNETLLTDQGSILRNCICTDKDDLRCNRLKNLLQACLMIDKPVHIDNSVEEPKISNTDPNTYSSASKSNRIDSILLFILICFCVKFKILFLI